MRASVANSTTSPMKMPARPESSTGATCQPSSQCHFPVAVRYMTSMTSTADMR